MNIAKALKHLATDVILEMLVEHNKRRLERRKAAHEQEMRNSIKGYDKQQEDKSE